MKKKQRWHLRWKWDHITLSEIKQRHWRPVQDILRTILPFMSWSSRGNCGHIWSLQTSKWCPWIHAWEILYLYWHYVSMHLFDLVCVCLGCFCRIQYVSLRTLHAVNDKLPTLNSQWASFSALLCRGIYDHSCQPSAGNSAVVLSWRVGGNSNSEPKSFKWAIQSNMVQQKCCSGFKVCWDRVWRPCLFHQEGPMFSQLKTVFVCFM